jgi:CBS-domain-containing membrane protein
MLTGNGMECSAIEVKAPSGKNYTMSAGHCAPMAVNEYIMATREDGSQIMIKVLKVDAERDLMLLEAADEKSIDVANSEKFHQHIHTLTHGHGMPTYRTDGELLKDVDIKIEDPIGSEEEMKKCKNIVVGAFEMDCELKLHVIMSTAQVLPGSSGGAILNKQGQLVGIVSCTDGFFSGFVMLKDIQEMLKAR